MLSIYQDRILDFINKDFEILTLANDCLFTEGPVWSPEGFYLFSDITANCIYKITEGGEKEIYLEQSGTSDKDDPLLKPDQAGSNGLAFDRDGCLIVCRHGSHELAKLEGNSLKTIAGSYEGRPLNSPNDLIVHPDGTIYFSDPPYGLKEGKLNPGVFQPQAAVYAWKDGMLKLVCDRYQYPNGVCLSNDGTTLYICSNKPFEKYILMYEHGSHRFLGKFAEENSDGIEIDAFGNIYLCNKDGIILLDQRGERMALISLPAIPANCCWNDAGDLFITARENIFLLKGLAKR